MPTHEDEVLRAGFNACVRAAQRLLAVAEAEGIPQPVQRGAASLLLLGLFGGDYKEAASLLQTTHEVVETARRLERLQRRGRREG